MRTFDAPCRGAAQEAPSTDHILHVMGESYCVLRQDRELLLCQLQAYAACSDPEIRDAVGDEWSSMYAMVRDLSGASEPELEQWFAIGMLMNTAAAIGPEMAEIGKIARTDGCVVTPAHHPPWAV